MNPGSQTRRLPALDGVQQKQVPLPLNTMNKFENNVLAACSTTFAGVGKQIRCDIHTNATFRNYN